MTAFLKLDPLLDLPRTTATEVKTLGWRSVMKSVARTGKVLITNHNEPEAVILSARAYGELMQALQSAANQTAPALDALRQRFDDRLAVLQAADAGDRLRDLMQSPAQLGGEVKAGSSH